MPNNYKLDVFGRIQKPYYKNSYFSGVKNLAYKGAFTNISKLPIEDYDAYLYTAQTDGIPNTLLEIISLGLPIVATKEGGVPDLIEDGENGRLIDLNDIEGYGVALKDIVDNKKALDYVKKAQAKIKKRHSWKEYKNKIKQDIQ